ncbi:MAG TPA: hypothetical protein VNP72_10670 [Longimicrobium sp.]|nr:hypothetical protein [Longimicrobium sp.]
MSMQRVQAHSEEMSPERFLQVARGSEHRIRSVRIRPPRLGEDGFGALVVEYYNPFVRPQRGSASPR